MAPEKADSRENSSTIYARFFRQLTERIPQGFNLGEPSFAWYDSWKKNSRDLDAFRNVIEEAGVSDCSQLERVTILPHQISKDPTSFSRRTFTENEVRIYFSERGAKPDAFTLKKSDLAHIQLKNYGCGLVPIFFERSDGLYQPDFVLMEANRTDVLCYAIPESKSKIIDGAFKGKLFEHFVRDILTGEIIVEIEDSVIYTSQFYFREKDAHHEPDGYYRPIRRDGSCRIKLKKRRDSTLKELIYSLGETDIDIVLVHDSEPKHVLLGECCFTKDYNEDEYQSHRNRLSKIYEFLNNHPESIIELGLPEGYPIVPVLFTSFTGEIHKEEGPVRTISLISTILGGLEALVQSQPN